MSFHWKVIRIENGDYRNYVCVRDSPKSFSDMAQCMEDGLRYHQYHVEDSSTLVIVKTEMELKSTGRLECDSIICNDFTENRQSYRERLSTFKNWPLGLNQKKEDMAQSGFVYTGIGDAVKCHCCQIKLRNWNPSDSITIEHRKHSPYCSFLK